MRLSKEQNAKLVAFFRRNRGNVFLVCAAIWLLAAIVKACIAG